MGGRFSRSVVVDVGAEGLRPAERVLNFMDKLSSEGGGCGLNGRLPSIRQLSRRLNVSAPTVQGVFRKLAAEGRIRTERGSGTFLASAKGHGGKGLDGVRLALNFSMQANPLMEDWMMYIGMGVLRAASSCGGEVALAPIQEADVNDERAIDRIISRRKDVDGLILFPCRRMADIRAAYAEAGKPVVNVTQPFVSATCDFVSADYYSASFALGVAMRKAGRRRALLLFSHRVDELTPMRSLHAGFASGFGVGSEAGARFECREGVGFTEDDGAKAVCGYLRTSRIHPDVVYASSDYLAVGAVSAFMDAGIKVPDEVSVVGGTGLGLTNSHLPGLTRVAQPMDRIGSEALAMMLRRLSAGGASEPGVFLPAGFKGAATVRAVEFGMLTERKGER